MLYTKQKSSHTNKNLLLACAVFIFFALSRFFFAPFFSSSFEMMAKPFWQLRDSMFGQAHTLVVSSEPTSSLTEQIMSLQSQLYDAQIKNAELTAQNNEFSNDNFKLFLAHVSQITPSTILAKVISKPPFSPFDTFILDSGSKSGITVGASVYIGNKMMVGKITQVYTTHSIATLFSSGFNSTQADIARSGQSITLHGRGGGDFEITLPKDFDIALGDMLVDTGFKQGVIAQVYYVDTSSIGSFKSVYARLPVNVFQSEWVEVDQN